MKAISTWQPYASLIAAKIKPFETRSWSPPASLIGQRIAIHAAKKNDRHILNATLDILDHLTPAQEQSMREVADGTPLEFKKWVLEIPMSFGCIVCTATLDSAHQMGSDGQVISRMTSRPMPHCFRPRVDPFGDYSEGRWVWLLTDVQPVRPFAVKGRQGFFDVELPA